MPRTRGAGQEPVTLIGFQEKDQYSTWSRISIVYVAD
jgi:hypothetical protein